MATINVKATVSAPSEINIPLVRADYHAMSNIFRLFFEFFLAVFSGTLGIAMTQPSQSGYWFMLITFGLSALSMCDSLFITASHLRTRSRKSARASQPAKGKQRPAAATGLKAITPIS